MGVKGGGGGGGEGAEAAPVFLHLVPQCHPASLRCLPRFFFVFFWEQFVLARKMSRYPVSSASIPPSPLRRRLSRSLQLSLQLAFLLRRLMIGSFLFLPFEGLKVDS